MPIRFAVTISALILCATPLVAQKRASRAAQSKLPWNQWLGAARDGLSPDKGLLQKWPEEGPRLLWKAEGLGESFSSVSFAGDRIFTMGDVDGASRLLALRKKDGEQLWSARVGRPGGTRNPGPRATPATDGKLVFGLGHDGSLVCAEAVNGKVKWRKHLVKDFDGVMMSRWGYSESPLLDGGLLVCTPGGSEGSVVALDKKSGEVVWRCVDLTDPAAYSSIVPIEVAGVPQYLVLTGRTVAGIDRTDGSLLWSAAFPGKTAVCATPLYRDGYVFATAGYGVGCVGYKVSAKKGRGTDPKKGPRKSVSFSVEEIYAGKQMQNHHGGVVLVGDHVYGMGRRNLKCIELQTGKVVWENRAVGKGSITYADGHLICRSERGAGMLALVEASPKGYREKGRFEPDESSGEPTWAYPVVFGGRLYVRDQDLLYCYDLRKKHIR